MGLRHTVAVTIKLPHIVKLDALRMTLVKAKINCTGNNRAARRLRATRGRAGSQRGVPVYEHQPVNAAVTLRRIKTARLLIAGLEERTFII
jgi:hypothetical protein